MFSRNAFPTPFSVMHELISPSNTFTSKGISVCLIGFFTINPMIHSDTIQLHLFVFENTQAEIGSAGEKNVPYYKIAALVKYDQMGAVEVAANTTLAGACIIAFAVIECLSVPIDRTFA